MGKIIKNGKEYKFGTSVGFQTGGDTIEILTQAEYDELVAAGATDDDIYYFIEDEKNGGVLVNASNVSYDNSKSGMAATDVQGAVDEIDEKVDAMQSAVDGINTDVIELNQNINTHYNVNTNAFENYTLATAIGQLLASFPEKGTYSGRFKTSEGWYTIHCFYAGDAGKHSGYVSDIADATKAYIFSGSAGADAVLKKLGEVNLDEAIITGAASSYTIPKTGKAIIFYTASYYNYERATHNSNKGAFTFSVGGVQKDSNSKASGSLVDGFGFNGIWTGDVTKGQVVALTATTGGYYRSFNVYMRIVIL